MTLQAQKAFDFFRVQGGSKQMNQINAGKHQQLSVCKTAL